MSSFESMVRAEIANSHPSIIVNNAVRRRRSGEVSKPTTMYLSNTEPQPWRRGDSHKEEGWIEIHPDGEITIATLWDNAGFKRVSQYRAVLDVLKPELTGYHRCAGDRKYHPEGRDQDGNGETRWAKNLNRENYIETLSHYFHAMKRV